MIPDELDPDHNITPDAPDPDEIYEENNQDYYPDLDPLFPSSIYNNVDTEN